MGSAATFRLGLSTPAGVIFWETPNLFKLTMKINLLGQEFSEELTSCKG